MTLNVWPLWVEKKIRSRADNPNSRHHASQPTALRIANISHVGLRGPSPRPLLKPWLSTALKTVDLVTPAAMKARAAAEEATERATSDYYFELAHWASCLLVKGVERFLFGRKRMFYMHHVPGTAENSAPRIGGWCLISTGPRSHCL